MKSKIPLARPYFDSAELREVQKVLDSGWVTQGPKTKELEKSVADYLGVKYAAAVTNCTSALHLALLSIGIKEGDEVIVADYTFPATGHAVLYCKAKPVFVDVDLKTYNIEPASIEKKITSRTKAIIPVHVFGQPAAMDAVMRIARKHGLKVIEDAACALGAKYRDRFAGTIGDIGCFSLHGRKGITTGEGGLVVTGDKALAEKIRTLSVFGMTKPAWAREACNKVSVPEFNAVGYNYKMSDITAAVGMAQLRKLDRIIRKKQSLAAYWDARLKEIKYITPPYADKDATHIYQSYVALVDENIDRNKVIMKLMEKGIQAQIGTYASCLQPVYRSKDKCPDSISIFKRALALPMYYTLEKKDIDTAAETLKEILEEMA